MRASVCILIGVLSFLMISQVRSMECNAAFGPYACKDGTDEYVTGDEWTTKDCQECKCNGVFSICCNLQPAYFDFFDAPKGCRFIWDTDKCESRAVDEYDSSKPCPEEY